MNTISNIDNVIDSRDIIEQIFVLGRGKLNLVEAAPLIGVCLFYRLS